MEAGRLYDEERGNVRAAVEALDTNGLRRALEEVPALKVFACSSLCELLERKRFCLEKVKVRSAFVNAISAVLDFCLTNSTESLFCIKRIVRALQRENLDVLLEVANRISRQDNGQSVGVRFVRFALQCLMKDLSHHEEKKEQVEGEELQAKIRRLQSILMVASDGEVVNIDSSLISTEESHARTNNSRDIQFLRKNKRRATKPRLFLEDKAENQQLQKYCEGSDREPLNLFEEQEGLVLWSQILLLYAASPTIVTNALRENKAVQYIPEFVAGCLSAPFPQVTTRSHMPEVFRTLTCLLMRQLQDTQTNTALEGAQGREGKSVVTATNELAQLDAHVKRTQRQCLDISSLGAVVNYDVEALVRDVVSICLSRANKTFSSYLWQQKTWIPMPELKNVISTQLRSGKYPLQSALSVWAESANLDGMASATDIADQLFVSVLGEGDLLSVVLGQHGPSSLYGSVSEDGAQPVLKKPRLEGSTPLLKILELSEAASSRAAKYKETFWKDLACVLRVVEASYLWETLSFCTQHTNQVRAHRERVIRSLEQVRTALQQHVTYLSMETEILDHCLCGATRIPGKNAKHSWRACTCSTPCWTSFLMPGVSEWCLWSTMNDKMPENDAVKISNGCGSPAAWMFLGKQKDTNESLEIFQMISRAVLYGSASMAQVRPGRRVLSGDVKVLLEMVVDRLDKGFFQNSFQQIEGLDIASVLQRIPGYSAKQDSDKELTWLRTAVESIWKVCHEGRSKQSHSSARTIFREAQSAERILRLLCPSVRDVDKCAEDMETFAHAVAELCAEFSKHGECSEDFIYIRLLILKVNKVDQTDNSDVGDSLCSRIQRCFSLPLNST